MLQAAVIHSLAHRLCRNDRAEPDIDKVASLLVTLVTRLDTVQVNFAPLSPRKSVAGVV